jgi:small nuclear ribonucleoprotein (snRNP)-like protein
MGRRIVFSDVWFGFPHLPKPQSGRNMESRERWQLLTSLFGHIVVVDLKSSYVCLGTLASCDDQFLELRDADLHDFRDSTATREVYVYDSVRFGIRRNRSRVLIRQDDVVAITRFADIAAS